MSASRDKAAAKRVKKRLAKAVRKLRTSQDNYAATREEGEQSVRRVRLEAERDLARAGRKVERRTQKVATLEEELQSVAGPDSMNGSALSPEATVDVLAHPGPEEYESPIITPRMTS